MTGVDNLMGGSLNNLAQAVDHDRFRFVEADVIEPYEADADILLNLACTASPIRYQAAPLYTMRNSVLGAFNACDAAMRSDARLVHSSTIEIYGDPKVHPQHENYCGSVNPIRVRACYDEGKRAAETILFDYNRLHGLDMGMSRIFNTNVPRMDPYDGRVVSTFIWQALMGEPLTIFGDGQQTRPFCFADDLVEGLWRLCYSGPDVRGPINLGNPVELTVLDLAELIRELIGRSFVLEDRPLPVDDPSRRRPEISRAEHQLGWRPTVSLREGLERTIEYFETLICSGAVPDYARRDRARGSKAAE